MITSTLWLVTVYFFNMIHVVKLLDNGLARKPPMGWMSWGYYECNVDCNANSDKCLDENLIKAVADTFYTEGYLEAGYEYIIIDDCWAEMDRDSDGRLVPDKKRFPKGMKHLADYIHNRGLKFGMYTNIGETTCKGYPGSKDHFALDAQTFAQWEVDYLKVDGCFVGEELLNTAYIELGNSLNATGRPMVYSCSWPYYIEFIIKKTPDYGAVSRACNMWRNYHDVVPSWRAVKAIILHYAWRHGQFSRHHGPGQWNDPDMLIFGTNSLTRGQSRVHLAVYAMMAAPLLLSCDMRRLIFGTNSLTPGQSRVHLAVYAMMAAPLLLSCDMRRLIFGTNSLTPGQSRVHLAVYAMMAAPLLLSCDMRRVTDHERRLLLNLDLIAIAQDPLGVMAEPFQNSIILWMKQHHPRKGDKYHSASFALVNLKEKDIAVSFTPGDYGLNCTDGYTVMDPFTRTSLRNITLNDVLNTTVPAEDVVMYTLFPL